MSRIKVCDVRRGVQHPERVYVRAANGSVYLWKQPLTDTGYTRLLGYISKLRSKRELLPVKDGNWIHLRDPDGNIRSALPECFPR